MKERPILFSAPMVQAILEGRKTQTRRICKDPLGPAMDDDCPYGEPGDQLWVRESFQPLLADDMTRYKPNYKTGEGYKVSYPATDGIVEYYDIATDSAFCSKMKPSIFMPRWASRITLEIVDVRVQRLQEISAEDIAAEGIPTGWPDVLREMWCVTWNGINAKRGFGWDANPWVWALSFRRIEAAERAA